MVDTPDSRPKKRTKAPPGVHVFQAHEFLFTLVESLWASKQREIDLRTQLASVQGHPCDWKGEVSSDLCDSLNVTSEGISRLSETIAVMVFESNGLTGDPPWEPFAFIVGTPPFQYVVSIEAGRCLCGEYLVSSFEPRHARVIASQARRFFNILLTTTTETEPTHPTQGNPS
jgi:hypothetical protein